MAAVDLRAGVQPPNDFFVLLQTGKIDDLVGDLTLAVVVRGTPEHPATTLIAPCLLHSLLTVMSNKNLTSTLLPEF